MSAVANLEASGRGMINAFDRWYFSMPWPMRLGFVFGVVVAIIVTGLAMFWKSKWEGRVQ